MKIRRGFVSNSSSTSFVIMMTEDTFKKTINKAHPYIRHFVYQMHETKAKFAEKNIVLLSVTTDSGDFGLYGYSEDEALNSMGEVIKLRRNAEGKVENIYDYDLMYDSSTIYKFIKMAKEIDPDNVISSSNSA